MPVKFVRNISESDLLGVWCIDETDVEDFHFEPSDALCEILAQYKSPKRKMEVICTYALLYAMTGNQNLIVRHLPSGKPVLGDTYVSITHTERYVSVLLSKNHEVALDMEYRSSRVQRVASRFLRADERPANLDALLLHWCAKECAYKYWSALNLEFEEIRVHPLAGDIFAKGKMCVENLRENTCLSLAFEFFHDALLVYSVEDDKFVV